MNKKIFAMIIEDEIPASRLLSSMLRRLRPNWEIKTLSGSVEEAVEWFSNNSHPDLLFLDIQLADGNSFDFISKAMPSSSIIFTTAYDQYAIRAFSVNSIDYILKPIDQGRLIEAINKFESSVLRSSDYLETILDALQPQNKRFRSRFLIISGNKYITLQVMDVAFFYSENKTALAMDFTGKIYPIDLPLERLSEQLDMDQFFRVNRQTILSIKSIKKIEPYFAGKIVVTTLPKAPYQIFVSREKATAFKLWLNY